MTSKLDDARLREILAEAMGYDRIADRGLLTVHIALTALARVRDEALKEAAEVAGRHQKRHTDCHGDPDYTPSTNACAEISNAVLSLIPQPKEEGK